MVFSDLPVAGNQTITRSLSPATGSLHVTTDPPGATITIDGAYKGTTPLTITDLPVGDSTVELSLDGYETVTETVTITDGQTANLDIVFGALNSDGDGLSDHIEVNGYNDPFGNIITSDPESADTDGDGHSDYEEYYDPDYDPLVYEKRYTALEMGSEFTLGFICGEWLADDHDNIYYFSGWLASGFFVLGDLRDIAATLSRGDLIGTGLNLAGLIPGAGDAIKSSTIAIAFVSKHPEMAIVICKMFTNGAAANTIDEVRKIYGDEIVDSLIVKGYSEEQICRIYGKGLDVKQFDEIFLADGVFDDYPGIREFIVQTLTIDDGGVMASRVTIDLKKMQNYRRLGKPIDGMMNNIKGAYAEYLAKCDYESGASIVVDLSHINNGGLDLVVKEGVDLNIIECKAVRSLSVSKLRNYLKIDITNGDLIGFNMQYVANQAKNNLELLDYLTDSGINKKFTLYINSPESSTIASNLNLPASLPYSFKDSDKLLHLGEVEVAVITVNK